MRLRFRGLDLAHDSGVFRLVGLTGQIYVGETRASTGGKIAMIT
jgi:hypothetical protein